MQPLISIIIPTYNRAHLICETLDSVLAQSYVNWECIVVDDGSTDGTSELMEAYCVKDSRFQYHHRPKDWLPGGNAARNYGFELSKGEYVNWFDDDDVMLPNFLELKVNAFLDGIELVICSGFYVNEKLENPVKIHLKLETFLYKDYVRWKFKIVTNNILFRKSFLFNKELFNPKLKRGQEAELFARLFYKLPNEHYQIIKEPLFLYRQHPEGKTAIGKYYVPEYRRSQAFILIVNLKRGIELDDLEVKSYCFGNLVQFFFEGLIYKDVESSKYILKNVALSIKKLNVIKYLEIYTLGLVFVFFRRGSYYFEKRWKSFIV